MQFQKPRAFECALLLNECRETTLPSHDKTQNTDVQLWAPLLAKEVNTMTAPNTSAMSSRKRPCTMPAVRSEGPQPGQGNPTCPEHKLQAKQVHHANPDPTAKQLFMNHLARIS